ncbi:MAG: DNA/RNA non-specific endonuclease, partial [Bryobacteraceae bacterium]
ENAIFADVDVEDLKVSVIGGPLFSSTDPLFRGVLLPKRFWKVIYFRETGQTAVTAKGYVLTQEDLISNLEVLELPEFAVFEVPISQIGDMTGLTLSAGSATETTGRRRRSEAAADEGRIRRITSVREIVG